MSKSDQIRTQNQQTQKIRSFQTLEKTIKGTYCLYITRRALVYISVAKATGLCSFSTGEIRGKEQPLRLTEHLVGEFGDNFYIVSGNLRKKKVPQIQKKKL